MADMQILFRMIEALELEGKIELYHYLEEQLIGTPKVGGNKRIGGLFGGEGFYMSDDFDEYLEL